MRDFGVLLSQYLGGLLRNRYFVVVLAMNLVLVLVVLPTGTERGGDAYDAAWRNVHFLWSMVLLVAGAGVLDRDFSNGFAMFVLTKPVSREAYVLAKTFGLAALIAVGVGTGAMAIIVAALLRGDVGSLENGLRTAVVLSFNMAIWSACLVGLSGFIPGFGNSLCFYGLLVAGALLSSPDFGPWMVKPVLVFGQLIRPPSLTELYSSSPTSLPRWAAALHVISYPLVLLTWCIREVRRRDLLRIQA